jgi:hypothetical protein
MLRNCHYPSGFEHSHREASPMRRSTQPAAAVGPIVATLRAVGEAWREALAAHRDYERLRSRGMPHDTALRESLGLGRVPPQPLRDAAKPLCFAGKA